MVVDDIAEAILWRVSRGRPHHKVVRVQVLEEVDTAGVEVVIAPHLDELCTVNTHLLVPVTFHDNLLRLVARLMARKAPSHMRRGPPRWESNTMNPSLNEGCRYLSTYVTRLEYEVLYTNLFTMY